ncbi:MAG: macro domain-containing protein [Clostridia bacterium]|nr:macro domain-containing protein [Clostridia bacterium]
MPLTIIRNDITTLTCDAIVNAANSQLRCGGGVCGAIFKAAGITELTKACSKIGFCDIGQAVITKGFNLKAKYIIHTVGPIYGENPNAEEEQLCSCYKNSLLLAKKKRLSSIAFPLISSGIYGYPKVEALKIATKAIKAFLEKSEMQVYLVVYDKDSFAISEKMFSAVESYIDERMVKPKACRFDRDVFPQSVYRESSFLNEECDFDDEIDEDSCFDTHPKHTFNDTCSFPTISQKSIPKPTRSLSDLVGRKVETFSEMLLRLIDEKGMTDVEVYKRANIDRKLFSKIRKKDYIPKKTTVIALAISLRLNMDEAKDLLGRAGFAFSQASKFDIIIEYFIENENYDIFEINETLFAFDEQVLGA